MTKSQLIRLLYYKNPNLTEEITSQIVDLILNEIVQAMRDQKYVEIRGFGKFTSKERRAKTLKHPATSQPIQVPAHKTMKYYCSTKALAD